MTQFSDEELREIHDTIAYGSESEALRLIDELGEAASALRLDRGMTLLHLAVGQGRLSLAEELVKLGADVEATDRDGETPLNVAFSEAETEVIVFLLELGANPYTTGEVLPNLLRLSFLFSSDDCLDQRSRIVSALNAVGYRACHVYESVMLDDLEATRSFLVEPGSGLFGDSVSDDLDCDYERWISAATLATALNYPDHLEIIIPFFDDFIGSDYRDKTTLDYAIPGSRCEELLRSAGAKTFEEEEDAIYPPNILASKEELEGPYPGVVCPLPLKWKEIHTALRHAWEVRDDPTIPCPPGPLILAGWACSDQAKRRRFLDQVHWAVRHRSQHLLPPLEPEDQYGSSRSHVVFPELGI